MNANELADALQETEPYYSTDYKLFDQAATMLRQQQAKIEQLLTIAEDYQLFIVNQKSEIEALKMDIHSLTYGERLAEYLRKAQEK